MSTTGGMVANGTADAIGLPVAELGGLPFLDDGFGWRRLLAAVAAVRHLRAEALGLAEAVTSFEQWLTPARAVMVTHTDQPLPALPLPVARKARIDHARETLASGHPAWQPLVWLPVRFAALHPPSGAISASTRAWPQHVLLADDAFASSAELSEQILHELAHQWIYLIQELWALQTRDDATYTLPSGTGGRTASEVLGAAHVAATLIRLHHRPSCNPSQLTDAAARIERLTSYGNRCLATLTITDLTQAGHAIARRLKEAL